mmetsp:Transcript_36713/g.88755  ORF Transcript_36713/g.88755 Transcript_36713/m.88755 type:complete len:220 (-) Transcript_36713:7826-8485(-)
MSDTSSISSAASNNARHCSAPPIAYATSITSTSPTTAPSWSQHGSVRNLLSCMNRKASRAVISGPTASGSGVMTSNTKVDSGSEPLDTTRFSMSLKPKIPTSSPPSTTKAALRFSDMTVAASITLVSGETIVFGVPERMLPNVLVLASDPAVFDSKGPKRACNAAASALPAAPRATFTNDSAEEGFVEADFSIFEMASLRHLAISSNPTTSSSFPNTGR